MVTTPNELTVCNWSIARNWLARGYKVRRVSRDKDSTVYTLIKTQKPRSPRSAMQAVLCGREQTSWLN